VRSAAARRVASQTMMIESFLLRVYDANPEKLPRNSTTNAPPLLYHAHCHQKALVGSADAVRLLKSAYGDRASEINSGCCGMAGSFGHETEHYEIARAMGEHRLFPAIRETPGALVAIEGFSCRQQIEHHTARQPRHLIEYLADPIMEVE
jgi:Fe-S oxidoreductase